MIIGQYLDRYLSRVTGTTLRCTFLSKHIAEENQVVVYSKDLHPILFKKVEHFPTGKVFLPKKWPYIYSNSEHKTHSKFFNKVIRRINYSSDVSKGNYDILHCHGLSAAALANVYSDKIGVPMIYDIHGMAGFRDPHKNKCQYKILKKFQGIISISQAFKQYLTENHNVDPSKIFVVPDGIDFETLNNRFSKEKCTEIREKLDLGGKKVLMYVGNFANQSMNKLLQIIEGINNKIPNAEEEIVFVIITHSISSSDRKKISDFQKSRTNLVLHGAVPYEDIFLYLRIADILLLPLYHELWENNSFNLVSQPHFFDMLIPSKLYTYLASGVPVLATNFGGIRELVHDNINGLLASRNNIDEFIDKALELLHNKKLCKQLGIKGRESIKEKYSWKRVSNTLSQVYEDILTKNI